MKRSEMLDLMTKTIICQETGFSISLDEADILLKEMEELGMLPPKRVCSIDSVLNLMLPLQTNTWEPEEI